VEEGSATNAGNENCKRRTTMATKNQKSALTASLQAEEVKVAAAQPVPAEKPKVPVTKATTTPARAKAAVAAPAAKAAPAPAKPAKAAAPAKPTKADKVEKAKKAGKREEAPKVVRDSFTMPKDDYDLIAELKKKCAEIGIGAKKGELLRAGLKALSALSPAQLKTRLAGVEKIKTGRPSKGKSGKK
jgi:hypothetical protein